jgi:hypothetical protein
MKNTTLVWLLCFTVCGTASVWAQNAAPAEYVVPMKLYDDHLIVVRGGLGDLADCNLLLDTGAYPTVIDREVARKLKLQMRRDEMHVVERDMEAGSSLISRVLVGPLQVGNLPVIVEDLSGLSSKIGLRVDALVGLDVLSHTNVRVNYSAKEVAFGAPARLTFAAPLEAMDSMALLSMNVNGHTVHLLVDTGAAKTVLFARRVPWLELKGGHERQFNNLGGKFPLHEVKASTTELGGVRIALPDLFVSDTRNMESYPFDGFMSTRAAHFRQIAFDFERGIFSWDAEEPPQPNNQPASSVASATSSGAGGGSAAISNGLAPEVRHESLLHDDGAQSEPTLRPARID